jgi:hypothetical protein
MKRIQVVLLMLSACALAHSAGYDGKSLQVNVSPEMPFVTGQVTVSGSSGAFQDNSTVTATFSPPSGAAITRSTQLTEAGTFELVLSPLSVAGTWNVEVAGPLSEVAKETASVEFDVIQPAAAAAVSVRGFTEGTAQMAEFLQVTEEQLGRFTELPEKEQAGRQVSELQDHVATVDAGLNQLADTLDSLSDAMGHLQAFPEMQEAMVSLAGEVQGPLNELQSVSQQLHYTHETANKAREWCRTWHAQKEGMKYLKDMVMLIFGGTAAIKGWATGKLTGAMKSTRNKLAAETAGEVLGLTEQQVEDAQKALEDVEKADKRIKELTDIEGNLGNWAGEALSGGLDWLIDWIATKVAPNCGMYDAKVKGKLYVEYYTKRMVYMVAKYDWDGKIELFFQKRQSETDIVRLKGQIWGSFGWRTGEFYPERTAMDIPGVTGVGLCIPRPPYPDIRDFYLTVEGEGKPEGVELWVKEASYDKARLPYGFISVLWSPYQMVPAVDFPTMDVPGGEWFVTRVTGLSNPDVERFYVPLEVEGDEVILKHNLERTLDYREKGEFRAFLKMEIDGKEGSL